MTIRAVVLLAPGLFGILGLVDKETPPTALPMRDDSTGETSDFVMTRKARRYALYERKS